MAGLALNLRGVLWTPGRSPGHPPTALRPRAFFFFEPMPCAFLCFSLAFWCASFSFSFSQLWRSFWKRFLWTHAVPPGETLGAPAEGAECAP